jgi:hypothetical protein
LRQAHTFDRGIDATRSIHVPGLGRRSLSNIFAALDNGGPSRMAAAVR